MRILTADQTLVAGVFQSDVGLVVDQGEIVALGATLDVAERFPGAERVHMANRAIVPGCVNLHNHSFQSLLRGIGDDLPFMEWRDRSLYKYTPRLGPEGCYAGALLAFGEMLGCGVTTVADFFYIHDGSNEGARAVIRAARQLGIRLVLARTMYDWDGAPPTYRESVDDAVMRTRDLAAEVESLSTVSVQPAPHSPHGASPAMIERGVALARELGTPFHIHLAEGKYEVQQIKRKHGKHPLAWLDSMGCLGPDTIAVHCVWCGPAEIELMANRGVNLAYNPASNMFLGDGITKIPQMLEQGINIGLGTDGGCTNSRVSVFDEMRSCSLLQKVSRLDPAAVTAADVLQMGTLGGARALTLPVGELSVGKRADLVVLDLEDLSLWPPEHLLQNVVYSMSPRAIREVWVDGQVVARDGVPTRVDPAEIRAQVLATVGLW